MKYMFKSRVAFILTAVIVMLIMIVIASYTYNKSQSSNNQLDSPQVLYKDFFTKIKKQDRGGVKNLSCYHIGGKANTDSEFDYFYQNLSKYNFDSAEYSIKLDSSYYFDITKVKLGDEPKNIKLYYSKLYGQTGNSKNDSYCMEYSGQSSYELT